MSFGPECLKSRQLEETCILNHGFFTRQGGLSEGIYKSLNTSYESGDSKRVVRENREIIRKSLGAKKLLTVHQCHTNKVEVVNRLWADNAQPKADALVTNVPRLAIGVKTADCAPVLFADPINRVIGAAHAGWKGALAGILDNTLDSMEGLGANRRKVIAVLGPCIAQKSYEVGEDMYQKFINKDPRHRNFFARSLKEGKYLFDLKNFVLKELSRLRVGRVGSVHQDTFDSPTSFFSYRYSCKEGLEDYGRQLSALCLHRIAKKTDEQDEAGEDVKQ